MMLTMMTALALFACGPAPEEAMSDDGVSGDAAAVEDTATAEDTGAGEDTAGDASCLNSLPSTDELPSTLSETGLFSGAARAFAPRYPLWTDGAEKSRWAYLPECEVIDNSDPDGWVFPVGTRMWKEFSVGGQPVETRMIHRFGPGPDDFLFASYVWDEAGEQAPLWDGEAISTSPPPTTTWRSPAPGAPPSAPRASGTAPPTCASRRATPTPAPSSSAWQPVTAGPRCPPSAPTSPTTTRWRRSRTGSSGSEDQRPRASR